MLFPQPSGRLYSVYPFHLNIKEEDLAVCLLQAGDQLFPAGKFTDVIIDPAQLQLCAQDFSEVTAKVLRVVADRKL